MLDFKNVKKILVATDGSSPSMRAAEYGISIAKMLEAQILVVHAVDPIVLDQARSFFEEEEHKDLTRKLKEAGQHYVDYVLDLAEKEQVGADSLIVEGNPFEQIVHTAEESNVDLIVMGTHGGRGTERLLIGSVAERVIEYSRCPVLVVK